MSSAFACSHLMALRSGLERLKPFIASNKSLAPIFVSATLQRRFSFYELLRNVDYTIDTSCYCLLANSSRWTVVGQACIINIVYVQ
jgi:hypothetical protein